MLGICSKANNNNNNNKPKTTKHIKRTCLKYLLNLFPSHKIRQVEHDPGLGQVILSFLKSKCYNQVIPGGYPGCIGMGKLVEQRGMEKELYCKLQPLETTLLSGQL